MNVYVESNFVLELAFTQEHYRICDKLVRLCESRHVQLILPAYSIIEPYEKIIRQRKQRHALKLNQIDPELRQLGRTPANRERVREFESLANILLISSAD